MILPLPFFLPKKKKKKIQVQGPPEPGPDSVIRPSVLGIIIVELPRIFIKYLNSLLSAPMSL